MPADRSYNGWSNYETWCVKLWLTNDQASDSYWRDRARSIKEFCEAKAPKPTHLTPLEDAAIQLAEELEETISDNSPLDDSSMYTDLLNTALSEVNWMEIAKSFLEGLD